MPPPRQPNRAGSGNSRAGTPGARRQILNVTARKDRFVQQRKSRALARIAVTFLGAALLIGAVFGALYVKDRFFLENPHYNLQDLEVKTDGTLPQDVIVKAAGLQPGVNLFKLDLADAARRLEALPQVESVRLQRSFPATVTIRIIERKPIAWMVAEGNILPREQIVLAPDSYLADQTGMLLHLKRQLPEYAFLPIIRGCDAKDLAPGRRVDAHEGGSALELIRAHRSSLIGARFGLQEIDVSKRFGLVATDRNGLQVLFGLEDFEGQLKRLDVLLTEMERTGQHPASINLMVLKNTPVTLKTDGSSEAPTAASPIPEKPPGSKSGAREPAKPKPPVSEPKSNEIPVRKAIPVRPT
jgi:cell division protein FtsQ